MPAEVLSPAYRIHTQRLVMRCWHPSDAPLLSIAIAQSLDHLRVWMPWAYEEPKNLQQRINWLRESRGKFDLSRDFLYGVFNTDETLVLGAIGLHSRVGKDALEIGYWIHAHHVNQGLATEAAAALTRVAFEVNQVARVEIHCDPNNFRSAAVPKKLGFSHEATLRQRVEDHERRKRDSMIWTLFAEDYLANNAAAAIEAFDVVGQKIL
ncbi:MAG: GNAT family N-acetyltransferase [Drouetiella hepatica Uher 2000/2452]|jgi:RimJ/RimL family protein N-acetyltransferase|uniref:GNAT family N-acetyltransferase n=1 Tax=Drouetiella hepatica Uher 2000/2452 TaxID=904376 RepID=A0A951UN07_9CYAN|nr:GNAT family N-acetyltransferase [Drouetiella hepatica Uher 2000/2452]